jgi:hypothetical protein
MLHFRYISSLIIITFIFQNSRLYSTKLLGILLRAGTPGFSTWGMELLVTQLYDQSSDVAAAALGILDEACDIEVWFVSISC